MRIARLDREGHRHELPISVDTVIEPGEKLVSEGCGGGGFGNPLDRDPARVAASLRAGRITGERAASVYGVVLSGRTGPVEVDPAATAELRKRMRQGASA